VAVGEQEKDNHHHHQHHDTKPDENTRRTLSPESNTHTSSFSLPDSDVEQLPAYLKKKINLKYVSTTVINHISINAFATT
jgi:hypothetical protein